MVKIRLKQQGKKKQKSYRIVVSDSITKRDGATIEDIGFYNPLTNPSTIKLNKEKYEEWLKKGATPTATVKHLFRNLYSK